MRIASGSMVLLVLLGVGCNRDDDAQGLGASLESVGGAGKAAPGERGNGPGADADGEGDESDGNGGPPDVVTEGDAGIVLDCMRGGEVSAVHVEFDCDSITVYTCKDLSNIVLEFEDGTREKFDGQSGSVNTFTGTGANAGKTVVRVWVKAGSNHSGEGPGYGERVEGPEQDCDPPSAGSGGSGGSGGGGGEGGSSGEGGEGGSDACGSNDPDEVCADPPAGSGGSNGGQPFCEAHPEDPTCAVD